MFVGGIRRLGYEMRVDYYDFPFLFNLSRMLLSYANFWNLDRDLLIELILPLNCL